MYSAGLHNTNYYTKYLARLQSILDRGIFKVFWVFSRYFQCVLGIFKVFYKVFSSMRVGTRLCQRLAVAQSTLTSLIEQRPTTFRAPHRPRRPRQPRSRYASQNTKYNTNTYYTKYSRVPEVLCNPAAGSRVCDASTRQAKTLTIGRRVGHLTLTRLSVP